MLCLKEEHVGDALIRENAKMSTYGGVVSFRVDSVNSESFFCGCVLSL